MFKILHNPNHPVHEALPPAYVPVRHTRGAAHVNNKAFINPRFRTNQYARSFILATTAQWNALSNEVVDCCELQKFKTGANKILIIG